ncbi:MAG TPA: hypothetical protein ENJ95_09990 [Bacteroidetes bacterium]|nr:hypothetical protein [Bacteroidota bacterium]
MDLQAEFSKRPSRARALEIAAYIGDSPARFAQLIGLVLTGDDTVSKYASWLISHCMQANPQLVRPHIGALIKNLEKPKLSGSVVRSTVKALAETDIPPDLQGHALQHCFDFLLDPKTEVAIQVHAMQTIFNISKNEPDLLRELQMVIEEGMPHGTAGYRARGKRILKGIGKVLGN